MSSSQQDLPPNLGAVEPNELVRRALAGCADSYAELSRRFRPRLINLLRARLGRWQAEAEDVAQEAFARAFQNLERFNPRYQFSTWLYTIALRLASDHTRQQQRRPRTLTLDPLSDAHAAKTAAPSVTIDVTEQVDNLWSVAKNRLSELQYTAMWLRYGEGLSTDEVARVMSKTRIGIRVLLHRSRTILIKYTDGSVSDTPHRIDLPMSQEHRP